MDSGTDDSHGRMQKTIEAAYYKKVPHLSPAEAKEIQNKQ
jgi:hypothetical protein